MSQNNEAALSDNKHSSRCFSAVIENMLKGNAFDEDSDEDIIEEVVLDEIPFAQRADEFDDSGLAFESCDSYKFNKRTSHFKSNKRNEDDTEHSNNEIGAASSSSFQVTPTKNYCCLKANSTKHAPLTPTANLKVLLHAASPEIRNYERRKLMFSKKKTKLETVESQDVNSIESSVSTDSNMEIMCSSTENSQTSDVEAESSVSTQQEAPTSSVKDRIPTRKEKSLGLLCRRFLRLYPENPKDNISIGLDDAAAKLSVGRRRIYDIINVLESIKIVVRLAKNNYAWRGRHGLNQTLAEIKREAEDSGFAALIRNMISQYNQYKLTTSESGSQPTSNQLDPDTDLASAKRRHKSLGSLSKKFVTLFLVQTDQPISFDEATHVLITQGFPTDNKFKTKVRRLYDIANILTSLKLIKKISKPGRKPLFRWTGPNVAKYSSPSSRKAQDELTSPITNLWTSPSFKVVSFDDGFSSLCEVVEQERKDLCITTPDKSGACAFTTPVKGGPFAFITPIKGSSNFDLSANDIELDDNGNINLDSSFNHDEVFRKELESLRERFPSPMSRLLSACNVQQALSQHKRKKLEKIKAQQSARRSLNPINNEQVKNNLSNSCNFENASPVKLNLEYLKKQQAIISNAVGNAVEAINNTSGFATSSKTNKDVQQSTKLSSRQHILVPLSQIKMVRTTEPKQTALVEEKAPSCATSQHSEEVLKPQNFTFSMPLNSQPTASTFQLVASAGPVLKSGPVSTVPVAQTVQNHSKKAVKMLINPSKPQSSLSAFAPQERTPQKQQTVKLFKVQLTGKSSQNPPTPALNTQNFVKLDIQNLSHSHKPATTMFKRVAKTGGKPLTRRNSSVVTNLVTRLENYSTKDDSILAKRPALDALSNLPGCVPKILPKRSKLDSSAGCSKVTTEVQTPESSLPANEMNRNLYFKPLHTNLQTSTPRNQLKIDKENVLPCFGEVSDQFEDHEVALNYKTNNGSFASRSLSSTPISLQSTSRPASSNDILNEFDSTFAPADRLKF